MARVRLDNAGPELLNSKLVRRCLVKTAITDGVQYLGNLKPGEVDATMKVALTEKRQERTFWQAAKEIVQQCHQILKPGGHAIWVVKAFVRKGERVDFPGDWQRLCESVGFVTVCAHHAMLVKETKHAGLFGEVTEKTERKSFFRVESILS